MSSSKWTRMANFLGIPTKAHVESISLHWKTTRKLSTLNCSSSTRQCVKSTSSIRYPSSLTSTTTGESKIIRPGHFVVAKEINDRQKYVRELPVFWAEFCSNFEYKNCAFDINSSQYNFVTNFGQAFQNALSYTFEIGALENGYGHFFEIVDYSKLSKDFIYAFSLYCAKRHSRVL